MATRIIERPAAQRLSAADNGFWKNSRTCLGKIPRVLDIPTNTVIVLDVHGTLISRNQADNLRVVEAFRQIISRPAKEAGINLIMASAAPTRELQRVASLLDLGSQPAVAELGHVIMPAVLEASPQMSSKVTPEMHRALLDVTRWVINEGLPTGVFLEPKTILLSLNWSQAPQECQGLVDSIKGYINKQGLPLYVSVSDATLDVGINGINKASGLSTVIAGLGPKAQEMNILAVGDSRNDMDLLKVSSPGLCGGPSNSHPMVMEYVRAQGGIVSQYSNLVGTLDALCQLIEAV